MTTRKPRGDVGGARNLRRYGASISGAHRRIKSANFADLVSGLKRLRSAPRAASRPIAADVQASGLPQAAARGTLNALAVEAFNDLLKKHSKRQNVENPLLRTTSVFAGFIFCGFSFDVCAMNQSRQLIAVEQDSDGSSGLGRWKFDHTAGLNSDPRGARFAQLT